MAFHFSLNKHCLFMCFRTSRVTKKKSTVFPRTFSNFCLSCLTPACVILLILSFFFYQPNAEGSFNVLQQPERLLCFWVCRSKLVLVWKTASSHVAKMLHALRGRGRWGRAGRVRAGNRALVAYHKIDFAGKISPRGGRGGLQTHSCRKTLFSFGSYCYCDC